MRRSRSMAGVHIHWSEARSVWLTISSATPFTSAGAVKRRIALLVPNDPMRRYSQRLTLTLLDAPITSSVPSYCCDLDRDRFSDSATICRASCAEATLAIRSAKPSSLFILERLNQRSADRGLGRRDGGQKSYDQDSRHKPQRNSIRIFICEPYSGDVNRFIV